MPQFLNVGHPLLDIKVLTCKIHQHIGSHTGDIVGQQLLDASVCQLHQTQYHIPDGTDRLLTHKYVDISGILPVTNNIASMKGSVNRGDYKLAETIGHKTSIAILSLNLVGHPYIA